jgi:hypothetical protein
LTAAGLLETAIRVLAAAGVPFMVTGSYASSYHGEPRATLDLDIVIDPDAASLERLVAGLHDAGLYVDGGAASDALTRRTQFNAIATDGWKIDFIVRKDRPFSRSEFERRLPADLLGSAGYIATAEDMIVVKLEWAAASDSQRQLRDVEGILAANVGLLDRVYIERWVSTLGLAGMWERVRPWSSSS